MKNYSEKYRNLADIEYEVDNEFRPPHDLIEAAKTAFLSLDEKEKRDILEKIFYNKYCSDDLRSDIKKLMNDEDISGRANQLKVIKLYDDTVFECFLNPEKISSPSITQSPDDAIEKSLSLRSQSSSLNNAFKNRLKEVSEQVQQNISTHEKQANEIDRSRKFSGPTL